MVIGVYVKYMEHTPSHDNPCKYVPFIPCRVKVPMQCVYYQNRFHVYYRCILLDNVAVLGIEFIIQSLMT